MKPKKTTAKQPKFSDNPKVEAFFVKVFNEMFRLVGLKFTRAFVSKDGWYRKKTWSAATEDLFHAWFVEEYKKAFRSTPAHAEREFAWFNLAYGWMIAD